MAESYLTTQYNQQPFMNITVLNDMPNKSYFKYELCQTHLKEWVNIRCRSATLDGGI